MKIKRKSSPTNYLTGAFFGMACLAAFLTIGCTPEQPDDPEKPDDEEVAVEQISLDYENVTVNLGETFRLTATVLPENATDPTVSWESANPEIATVDANGMITGIAAGNTTVTASAGDKNASCTVTVNDPIPTIDMTGMTAEEVRTAIDEYLAEGATEFRFIGEFEKLGIATDASPLDSSWIDNPFIGTNVEAIDFSGVTGWPEVDVDGLMDAYWQTSLDGVYGLPAFAFSGILDGNSTFPELRELIFPDEVKALGSQALWNNPKLENVVCPGVESIGNQCFSFCTSLTGIDLPEATAIYTYAFRGSGITSISLPKVNQIYYGLFNECQMSRIELTAGGDIVINEHPFSAIPGMGEKVFNFDTGSCELVLNADKHYQTGTASPQASSATNWADTEWKSISFD